MAPYGIPRVISRCDRDYAFNGAWADVFALAAGGDARALASAFHPAGLWPNEVRRFV